MDTPRIFNSQELSEIALLCFAVFTVLSLGTVGYMFIEGWSGFDALYMTVITLSTVGFEEIHPLSTGGRIFTILLIGIGVGLVMLVLTTLASKILARQLTWVFQRRRMEEQINKLQEHTIVCGFGRLSRVACEELQRAELKLVIVERDPQRCEEAEKEGLLVVKGDATLDEVLHQAGITRAKSIISLLPSDSDNLYVVLSSREINPRVFITTRAESEVGERRLKQAGASRITSPYLVGGQKIAGAVLRPHVTDFLDLASSSRKGDLQIEEICIPPGSQLVGKRLSETSLRTETNVIIAAIISHTGETIFNPSGNAVIHENSTLIGLGAKHDFAKLENMVIEGCPDPELQS